LIHHSDRGSQYLSIKYTERLIEVGIDPSVGTVGDSHEFKLVRASGLNDPGDHSKAQNALAECVIGLFKTEVINQIGPWKSMREVEWETLKWVDWYNNRRLLGPIGYIPPAQAEEACLMQT
jgi:transposase InsO family protein